MLPVQSVEGIVVDVGWYRTTIRSFEREIYNIPNSVFSRNVVLNVTRKQREWRFFDFVGELFGSSSQTLKPPCYKNFVLRGQDILLSTQPCDDAPGEEYWRCF